MHTHTVLKRLPMGDVTLLPGEKVDASEWRNTPLLETQRYIRPIEGGPDTDFERRVLSALRKLSETGELADLLTPQPDRKKQSTQGANRKTGD